VWSPNPQLINEGDKLVSTLMSDDSNIPLQGGPGNACHWPIVRGTIFHFPKTPDIE
jgi:hypothetical protein